MELSIFRKSPLVTESASGCKTPSAPVTVAVSLQAHNRLGSQLSGGLRLNRAECNNTSCLTH